MEHIFLKIRSPAGVQQIPFLKDRLTIGRHKNNSVVLTDNLASRFHCVVEKTPQGFLLRDLQSSNGTLLNGQRIMNAPLAHNDVISIGSTHMTFLVRTDSDPNEPSSDSPPVDSLEVVDEVVDELEVLDDEPIPLVDDTPGEPESAIDQFRRIADAIPQRFFDVDAIELINTRGQSLSDSPDGATARGDNLTIFRLVLLICFRSHASDIHLEPRADEYLMRIRVDGNLLDLAHLTKDLGTRIAAIVKILCDLDPTQKTIVQEGHFAARAPHQQPPTHPAVAGKTRRVDYRISFVPTLYGQKLVVRVFDTANAPLLLEDLLLPPWMAAEVRKQLTLTNGIILSAGPTGSGKTTTLYSLLRSCGTSYRNIVTIEDPIEVQIEGATQLPVDEANGKSFAALLRSVLRQDPDVIMVGEIRDAETARIALQASITGHMVLSTVHTRDTVGTIFRLLDLGIEPYMVAQGLHVVMAQRLVRKLCPACRRPFAPTPEDRAKLGPAGDKIRTLYAPTGCSKCLGTGFAGRRGVFEFLPVTDQLRQRITDHPNPTAIQDFLNTTSFVALTRAGYQLAADGLTSIDEVERSVGN